MNTAKASRSWIGVLGGNPKGNGKGFFIPKWKGTSSMTLEARSCAHARTNKTERFPGWSHSPQPPISGAYLSYLVGRLFSAPCMFGEIYTKLKPAIQSIE